MATQKQPDPNILDLGTVVSERPHIRMADGVIYDLLNAGDLGPMEGKKINLLAEEYAAIAGKPEDEWDQDDIDLATTNLQKQIAVLSPVVPPIHLRGSFNGLPTDVLERLSFQELIMTLDFFIETTGILRLAVTKRFTAAAGRLTSNRIGGA